MVTRWDPQEIYSRFHASWLEVEIGMNEVIELPTEEINKTKIIFFDQC